MKITFCSNYFTHHQKALSDRLSTLTDNNFIFLGYKDMDNDRRKLGWNDDEIPTYVHNTNSEHSVMFLNDANVLIAGSFKENMLRDYIQSNKVIFRYSERPLKTGNSWIKYPLRFLRWHSYNPPGKPIYMLCASAYTVLDYHKFGLFKNRAYKWGYFPEFYQYSDIDELLQRKVTKRILWAGRFIDWKHPDEAIRVAHRLKNAGKEFQMDFIGTGPMEEVMYRMILDLGLSEHVRILGSMAPGQVRREMENAGIYLFTSDKQEGWGAVLNESMNSGCAVVASHLIGSVPYLVQNDVNGFVYESGNEEMLFNKVKYLLEYPEDQKRVGNAAYQTIANEWNADVAAERFINLAEHVLSGEKSPELYASGPCSRAKVIKESWFKG